MKHPSKAIQSIFLKTSPDDNNHKLDKRFRSYSGIPNFVRKRI